MAVAVATLRLRTAAADTPALRIRAARELRAADLSPAGLPPAAVLVVRRLVDPMPGRFGCGRLRPLPDWEAAVRSELAAVARTAARVDERGRLPSSAAAVLFADEAELLACLIADRAAGDIATRWWWRAILPRLSLPATIAHDNGRDAAPLMNARLRDVPAALTLLARWGEAMHVARALSAAAVRMVLAALAQEYALPVELVTPSAVSPLPGERGDPSLPTHSVGIVDVIRPPWIAWTPHGLDDDQLLPEVRCLFGVALGLHIAPSRLRTAMAIANARRWWHQVTRPAAVQPDQHEMPFAEAAQSPGVAPISTRPAEHPGAMPTTTQSLKGVDAPLDAQSIDTQLTKDLSTPPPVAVAQPPVPTELQGDDVAALPTSSRAEVAMRSTDTSAEQSIGAGGSRHSATEQGDQETTTTSDQHGRDVDRADGQVRSVEQRVTSTQLQQQHPQPATVDSVAAFGADGVVTELGGVLYLVHALQDLNLPEAFEEEWGLASTLGPWGTLDLIARALLGPRSRRVAHDPMWQTLALLADWPHARHHKRYAGDVGPHARKVGTRDPAYRVPQDWFHRFVDEGDSVAWTSSGGRVWLWSNRGFLLAHRRCRGRALQAARVELSRIVPSGQAMPPLARRRAADIPWTPPMALPHGCPRRFARLAAAIAPAVRHRLLLALGIEPHTARSADPIADRLALRGRLYVTSSHIDLVMDINRADLALRRAGLDRDPGWIPSYGRVIYFHFQ